MEIPNRTQPQEVSVSRSFWEPIGACGLQIRADARPHKYCGDSELGSAEKCETVAHCSRIYGILQKVYQSICPDDRTDGKIVEEDVTFYCNNDYKKSLDILKEYMVTALILIFTNWKKEFHVHVNASCIALGVVLTQDGREGLDHPSAFANCRLSKVEKKYSSTKREGLAMVYALQKYRHYLLGGHFKMYINHSVLKPSQ